MITCKEDLLNKYIDNTNEELFNVWYSFVKDIAERDGRDSDWLKVYKFSSVEKRPCGELYVNSIGDRWLDRFIKELTLDDFIPSENTLQSPVDGVTLETHIQNKRLTESHTSHGEAPAPLIIEDGSVCDTRKDIFKEILNLARENNAFIQFDGFTDDENDSIVVTFASSDDEYVVRNRQEFGKLVEGFKTIKKFERK